MPPKPTTDPARLASTDPARPGAPGWRTFDRRAWAELRAATPLPLAREELADLQGLNEKLSLEEVVDVYLPLSRLLNLRVAASQTLARTTDTFVGRPSRHVPFVVGIAGSVAVGKSTTARVLRALLGRWPDHPRVDLVTTDGFLRPNRVLIERGLMDRKGWPESYDTRALLAFLAALKRGEPEVSAPCYSHVRYDVVEGEHQLLHAPDIVIIEGLNVLQTGPGGGRGAQLVSDYFDWSIYVDADEIDIERWYVERFFALRAEAKRDPRSAMRRFAGVDDDDLRLVATGIWRAVNAPNLAANIAPTRERADVVLDKGPDHAVRRVHLKGG